MKWKGGSNTKQGTKRKSNPHRTGLFLLMKKGSRGSDCVEGSRSGPRRTAIVEHLLVRAGRAEEACSGLPPTLRERTAGMPWAGPGTPLGFICARGLLWGQRHAGGRAPPRYWRNILEGQGGLRFARFWPPGSPWGALPGTAGHGLANFPSLGKRFGNPTSQSANGHATFAQCPHC